MTTQLIPAGALVRRPLTPPTVHEVNLASYDVIAVSTSGGKDSQAMLSLIVRLAREQGVLERVVAVHADLGRVEWEGTTDVVRAQCKHLGNVPLTIVRRMGGVAKKDGIVYSKGEVFGDLLEYVEKRGAWPSSTARYCTSDFKRGPVLTVFTSLATAWRKATRSKRACRILDCVGLRAQESSTRAKKLPFEQRLATRTQRVDTWLPLLSWSVEHVWQEIELSGAPVHRAYSLGMPRLSCAFCVFAPKAALMLAGRHNRALLDAYVAVEDKIQHTFRMGFTLRSVRDAIDAEPDAEPAAIDDWTM